jgi:sugar phosphate isomerase/epimerase
MKTIICFGLLHAFALLAARAAPPRLFYAFDNGLVAVPTLEEKAALLKNLGYDGIGWRPGKSAEMLALLDRLGLKMGNTYVVLNATQTACPVPAGVVTEIEALKGRDTVVSLAITGKSNDTVVIPAIQRIAGIAERCGLKVAIYGHVGFHTDTDATILRLAKLADRPNLGVGFNLCHFLIQNDESSLEPTLRAAAPLLYFVSINGADRGDTRNMTWDRLIQPLGQGTFDNRQLLRLLDQIGYRGPVGLQCYNLKSPPAEHLAKSIKAWQALHAD